MSYYVTHALFIIALLATGLFLTLGFEVSDVVFLLSGLGGNGVHVLACDCDYAMDRFLCVAIAVLLKFVCFRAQSLWIRMSGAVFVGYSWHQLAFIGHDVGHNGITHNLDIDSKIGLLVGNTLTGVSMGTRMSA